MKILFTGFEPFGEISSNSTEMVLNELNTNSNIDTLLLPVENEICFSILKDRLDKKKYDFVFLLGQASKRDKISFERVALNLYDFPIRDNAGKKIVDERIISEEENALFTTLPIKKLQKELEIYNIDSEISNSAGTYICNEIFFKGLNYTKNTKIKLGFIHIPLLVEQNCIFFTAKCTLFQVCLGMNKIIEYCSKLPE